MIRAQLVVVLVALAPVAAVLACNGDSEDETPCNNIPPGGCPLSHGLACDDPSCEAAYACNPGDVWTLDHVCPPHEAGAPVDAAIDADASPILTPHDASIDVPPGAYGGPGCPDLETPDCMLGFALSCPPQNGCCDCEDLYVCNNGGWDLWGSCTVDGGIIETP